MDQDEKKAYGEELRRREEEEEFFIVRCSKEEEEEAGGVGVGAEDFWRKGYRLRRRDAGEDGEGAGEVLVPECFGGLGEEILAAGKAVGLLRALGLKANFGGDEDEVEDEEDEREAARGTTRRRRREKSTWKSFSEVVNIKDGFPKPFFATTTSSFSPTTTTTTTTSLHLFSPPHPPSPPPSPPPRQPSLPSIFTLPPSHPQPPDFVPSPDISLLLSDHLSPLLLLLQYKLHRVLIEECGLMEHLEAIEGLYLMRKGECIGDWCEGIWEKVSRLETKRNAKRRDTSLSFQFLTTPTPPPRLVLFGWFAYFLCRWTPGNHGETTTFSTLLSLKLWRREKGENRPPAVGSILVW